MRFLWIMLLFFAFSLNQSHCQTPPDSSGRLLFFQSKHTPFPHPDRRKGYDYSGKHYGFKNHYKDSTIAVFIPQSFKAGEEVDLVFYFHGWWNTVQKSLKDFDLIRQFSRSRKNAILVFPESARNAPDSFGGKLEQKDEFKWLVSDVLKFLQEQNFIRTRKIGAIVLAGHSGAYRVISFILNRGGLTDHIKEVYLFDALYDQIEKFARWITVFNGRFVDIVTPNGGTRQNSERLLNDLIDWGFTPFSYQGSIIDTKTLRRHHLVFIFTTLKHSEVINPYFGLFLQTSQ